MNTTCTRCGLENTKIEFLPFPGKLGGRLQDEICNDCFLEWAGMQTKILNEYRLNMRDPKAQSFVINQMKFFLGMNEPDEELKAAPPGFPGIPD